MWTAGGDFNLPTIQGSKVEPPTHESRGLPKGMSWFSIDPPGELSRTLQEGGGGGGRVEKSSREGVGGSKSEFFANGVGKFH